LPRGSAPQCAKVKHARDSVVFQVCARRMGAAQILSVRQSSAGTTQIHSRRRVLAESGTGIAAVSRRLRLDTAALGRPVCITNSLHVCTFAVRPQCVVSLAYPRFDEGLSCSSVQCGECALRQGKVSRLSRRPRLNTANTLPWADLYASGARTVWRCVHEVPHPSASSAAAIRDLAHRLPDRSASGCPTAVRRASTVGWTRHRFLAPRVTAMSRSPPPVSLRRCRLQFRSPPPPPSSSSPSSQDLRA